MSGKSVKKGSKSEKSLNMTTVVFLKTQVIMILLAFAFLFIGSFIVYGSDVKKGLYFYISAVLFSLVSFIGGYYSGYKIHKNGLVTGLVFCLPANIILMLISFATNKFSIDLTSVISFAVLLVFSMLGGVLSVNTRMKAKTNRKGRKA